MSINKHNIKRRTMMVVALAMILAVLAASPAHAATLSKQYPTTLTNTASDPSVARGEPVTFHLALTNDEPNDLGPVQVTDDLPEGVQFVSASSSQEQCAFEPSHGWNGSINCDLGTLPAGGTAEVDVVVDPQESGVITNLAHADMVWSVGLLANFTPIIPASVYVY